MLEKFFWICLSIEAFGHLVLSTIWCSGRHRYHVWRSLMRLKVGWLSYGQREGVRYLCLWHFWESLVLIILLKKYCAVQGMTPVGPTAQYTLIFVLWHSCSWIMHGLSALQNVHGIVMFIQVFTNIYLYLSQ
jgi:hypothetical protein